MKKQFFLLLLSIVSTICFSQERDTLALKSFTELSNLMNKTYALDKESAKELVYYYINKAKKENNKLEEFNGLVISVNYKIWDRNFNFKEEQDKIQAIAKENNFEKELMISFYIHANSYFYNGIWSRAVETYYKSLELAKQQNNLTYKHLNLKQIGYLNYFTGKLDESIKLQNEAYNLLNDSSQNQDSIFLSKKNILELNALELITRTYLFAKQPDSARVYNNKALNLKLTDTCKLKRFIRNKCKIAILEGAYNEAKQHLENFIKYCSNENPIYSFIAGSDYGEIYIGLKQYDKAIESLNRGLENYPLNNDNSAFAKEYIELFAKAYKHEGNLEKSNFYFEKYITADDKYGKIMDSVAVRIKNQEVLGFKAELDSIQFEKDRQQNYLKYLAFGATLVILSLLFMLLKFYRNKKENELIFQELLKKVDAAKAHSKIVDTKDTILEESRISDINEDTKQQILNGLLKLEEQNYFLKQECNSYNVAKKIKTNTSYLSKVINSHFQKNFNTYINDLRINYAIVKLKNDTRFRQFSIQSIAEDLGYKSADSFTKYFKLHTGLNPSFYIKQLNSLT